MTLIYLIGSFHFMQESELEADEQAHEAQSPEEYVHVEAPEEPEPEASGNGHALEVCIEFI